jgi:hypothetical protein
MYSREVAMTPAEVIAASIVPNTKSVFFLGCFESRVTLFAQQVRALNLVDALLDQGVLRETGRVAIVGGGVAGVTAAAALARAAPKLKAIDVYERKEALLHLQRGSDRYLHPHLYDWPRPGSLSPDAALPILNWQAGPAEDVAEAIGRQFEALCRASIINVKLARDVEKLTPAPFGSCRLIVEGAPKDGGRYDAVILSIGFGYESHIAEQNHSYWSPSILSSPIHAPANEHIVFVSGNGDGGLVDFMMATYKGLDHRRICNFITQYDGLADAEHVLLGIEERAWEAGAALDIYDEYRRVLVPALPVHLLQDVQDRLRPDVQVWFHTREPQLFRRDTAVLNRFGAFLAIMADENAALNRIHLRFGQCFVGDAPLTGEVHIVGEAPFMPFYRFLRLGADRSHNFKPFRALADAFCAALPKAAPGFRPATPLLTETAKTRFSPIGPEVLLPEPDGNRTIEPANSTFASLRLRIEQQADGRLVWSGDLFPCAVGRVWDDDITTLAVTCEVPASEAGPLLAALANPDIGVTQIAHRLGVSPATLYRYIPAARTANTSRG